jgi:hypothetical protein
MAPNLAPARAQAESLFDGTCTIRRDPEGTGDDIRDEDNLTSTPPVGDTTVIYTGPSLLRPPTASTGAQPAREGGADIAVEDTRARIPASVTTVRPGDVYTVDTSPNDLSLVGRQFEVMRVISGSWRVTCMLILADKSRVPRV